MQSSSRSPITLNVSRPRLCPAGLLPLALMLVAPVQAGTEEGIAAFEAGDYERAYRELEPEAEAGDAEAQYYLGGMYWQGNGIEKDLQQARNWMEKAGRAGHVGAALELGYMYSNGIGIDVDKERAARLYREAADAGDPVAQRNLGLMYKEGEGVEKNYEQAAIWFREAARQGDAIAAEKLGIAYYQGEGVRQDYEEAFQWFSQAARENRYWAQRRLAIMYDNGEGVEKDSRKAVEWYKKSIKHGNPDDKFLLAEIYRTTDLGSKKESLDLYRQAALQGDMFSQIHYGMYLMNGWGTDGEEVKDVSWTLDIEGYAWTLVAYERTGDPSAKNAMEVFKAGLTRDDIKRAEWRAQKILKQYGGQWDQSQ